MKLSCIDVLSIDTNSFNTRLIYLNENDTNKNFEDGCFKLQRLNDLLFLFTRTVFVF